MDTVKATLVDAMHFDIEVDGHHFMVDAASEVGGIDAGPQPVRLLIAGLAGCTGMDVISILRKKRQEVTHFEVEVNGARATDYPKVYTDIEVVYRVRATTLTRHRSNGRFSYLRNGTARAMAMLRKAANITNRYEIEQEY
ncbi:OsmC family protein [Candidatus Amarolinea dominans]|uniref:OsmC family protein n=1 Tax=Candidatus Amarolinea dominans TaxID=3140696 RepID=UPI0031CC9388